MSKREEDHLLSCLYPAGFTGLSGGVSAEGSFWASPSPPLPGSGPSSSLLLEAMPSSACRTTSGGRSARRGWDQAAAQLASPAERSPQA